MPPLPLIHIHLTGNATTTTPESIGWDRDEYLGQLVPFVCEALLVLLVIVYVVGCAFKQYSTIALLILEAFWLIEDQLCSDGRKENRKVSSGAKCAAQESCREKVFRVAT